MTNSTAVAWGVTYEGALGNVYVDRGEAEETKRRLDAKFPGHERAVVPLYAAPPTSQLRDKCAELVREWRDDHEHSEDYCARCECAKELSEIAMTFPASDDAVMKAAARYQWLRDHADSVIDWDCMPPCPGDPLELGCANTLDAAIDAALLESTP